VAGAVTDPDASTDTRPSICTVFLTCTRIMTPNADDGYALAALKTGIPITATQARTDPKVDQYLRELDAETVVWLPLAGDEATRRGVLIPACCPPFHSSARMSTY